MEPNDNFDWRKPPKKILSVVVEHSGPNGGKPPSPLWRAFQRSTEDRTGTAYNAYCYFCNKSRKEAHETSNSFFYI